MLYNKIPPNKFGKTWVGQFIIELIMGPLTVKLQDSPKASLGRRHKIVNVSRIKIYRQQTLYREPEAQRTDSSQSSESESDAESDVDVADEMTQEESSDEAEATGEETEEEEAPPEDGTDAEEVRQTQAEGTVEILGMPARRRRRLHQERMPDTIVAVETHNWTGVEYQFNVEWKSGRRTSVGRDRLLKGTPQERHVMLDYVRKNPGLASSLGGRMLR